jgi:acyl-CoA hydrolase
MDPMALYRAKLTTPADAVGRIASGVNLSMGMAMTEPPALLEALADRAAAGQVDDLKVYYSVPPSPDRACRHRHVPRDSVAHGPPRVFHFRHRQ